MDQPEDLTAPAPAPDCQPELDAIIEWQRARTCLAWQASITVLLASDPAYASANIGTAFIRGRAYVCPVTVPGFDGQVLEVSTSYPFIEAEQSVYRVIGRTVLSPAKSTVIHPTVTAVMRQGVSA